MHWLIFYMTYLFLWQYTLNILWLLLDAYNIRIIRKNKNNTLVIYRSVIHTHTHIYIYIYIKK